MQTDGNKSTLLLIDDQPSFPEDFLALTGEEFHVVTAKSGEEALRLLSQTAPDLVLLDLKLGRGIDGLETLKRIKRSNPEVPVIMVTAHASFETAVQAGGLGAAHYFSKAPNLKELRFVIQRHVQQRVVERAYREELQRRYPRILGASTALQKVLQEIATLAPADCSVLITGESGTGKELVAHEIHQRSSRGHRPMLIINCSNLPAPLFESEFFGHEAGAFTGATSRHLGKFEEAEGSTLFLDEIADLPLESQPKILRVLETGDFRRLNGNADLHTDVRIIAATNKNLPEAVKAGGFRKDLLYRLNAVEIYVPALREHREDVPLLARHYLEHFAHRQHKPVPEIPAPLMEIWQSYDWPGNVRELRNLMQNVVLFSKDGQIDATRLRIDVPEPRTISEEFQRLFHLPYEEAKNKLLGHFQDEYFHAVLERCEGNVTRAAEFAQVNRATIYRLLQHEKDDEARSQ
ncbi:sigma-54-dependent Fis family transcriptional regulator [candidate division KSB1 bacterium]|nr:sigma-54-dependent Fis family transcriptional regulator [candidate division KSB1 bacterium]